MDTRDRSPASQVANAPGLPSGSQSTADAEAYALLSVYEREAKALGNVPEAARLFHQMGLVWEERLKSPRQAATCYQNAARLNPRYVANLQSAKSLFADVGNWGLVGMLIDAEVQAATTDAERTSLLLEKASLLEERLSRPDEALALLEALATQSPGNPVVLWHLETAYAARGDHENLARVFSSLAEAVGDDKLKAYYYAAAASMNEDRLKKPEVASDLYRKAFALDRADPALIAAVARTSERQGKTDEALAALAAEAQLPVGNAAPTLARLARAYLRAGRTDEALSTLLEARKAAPEDPMVLGDLASIFEAQGRWEELAEVLKTRAAAIRDENELVALHLSLGALAEEPLKREGEAIARYRAVLAIAPNHAAAVTALGKLYHRAGNWQGLLETYEAEVTAAEDAKQKAAKVYKCAELLEERLGRVEEAIARYNEALTLSPGYLPAQKALARMYEKHGRFAELVAMHEQDIAQTKDHDQIISVLSRLALICEDKMNDLEGAMKYQRRILDVVPNHLPTIRNLSRLNEQKGNWEELVKLNFLEADLASDTKEILSLLHRNAEILEEQIGDKDRAVETYKKVLALSPAYLPALRALGRLYGQKGRWDELVEMFRQEAEVVPSPEYAASLLFRVGQIYEDKMNRPEQAIVAYQEVLTLSPSHFPALRALSRIYRKQGAWESLVDVLRSEAAVRTDPGERAHTLYRVAVLWEEDLGRQDMAIEAYQEVLRLSPAHGPALRSLERLYRATENWRELVAIYEREIQTAPSAAEKNAAYGKLARIYLDRLNEPSRAAQCYEAILASDAGDLVALKSLERIRAGDRPRRADIRSRLAQRVADSRMASAMYLAGSQDRERLGQADDGADLKKALALAPDDQRAASAAERALRRAGEWPALAAMLERRLAAVPESDTETRVALALRLGDVGERHLNDAAKARAAWRVALSGDPHNLPAIRSLRRLAQAEGNAAEVHHLYVAEAEAVHDPKAAVEAYLEAGQIALTALADAATARGNFGKALEKDPLDQRASQRYEELVASSGGAAELATLHERRGDAKVQSKDQKAAADEYFEAARVHAEKLANDTKAAELADEVLKLSPQHAGALLLRGELALKEGKWDVAAGLLSRRVELGAEPAELARLHATLGELYYEHLGDPSRATAHLATALVAEPGNLAALERLGKLHSSARNWTGAVETYRKLVDTVPDQAARAAHALALARVYEEGMGDVANAIACYRQSMELSPSSSEAVDHLAALYERTGNIAELVPVLEAQANASVDRAKVFALRMKLGELAARAGDLGRAVAALRAAVELKPDDVDARQMLADALAKEPATLPRAIEEHRAILKTYPYRLQSLHALFKLNESSRQADKALCAASLLAFFKATSEVEMAWYGEARNRLPDPARSAERLTDAEIDGAVVHPACRNSLNEILRLVGGDLHRLYEPKLETMGVAGKGDRLKGDHPVYRMVKALADLVGVERFDVYLPQKGALVLLENTDPLSIVVGGEIPRRYTDREQRFLVARGVLGLRNKTALATKLDHSRLANLLGATARVVMPEFNRLGTPDSDLTKRVRKALPGRVVKALEIPVSELAAMKAVDVAAWLTALPLSADRFGVLASGDIVAVMNLLLREDPALAGKKVETSEVVVEACRGRRDISELVAFVLSDDHYKLRTRLRVALG